MTTQSIVEQIQEIEANLRGLELGNDDVRFELLRKRNKLRRGDPNRLDQDLLDEYLRELRPPESSSGAPVATDNEY